MGCFVAQASVAITPVFEGKDKSRSKIQVKLTEIASGFIQPTDIQFIRSLDLMVVTEKTGTLKWRSLKTGKSGEILGLDVLTSSEQGLLGVAIHPSFPKTAKIYTYYSTRHRSNKISRISEWQLDLKKLRAKRTSVTRSLSTLRKS